MKKKVLMMTMAAVTLSAVAQQPVDYVNPIIGTNGYKPKRRTRATAARERGLEPFDSGLQYARYYPLHHHEFCDQSVDQV